jgi:hypothetical protein
LTGLLLALILFAAAPAAKAALARWHPVVQTDHAEDIAGPLGNGKLLLQSAGGLSLYQPAASTLQPFASGAGGYSTPVGSESYMALSSNRQLKYANCSFGNQNLYAIEPSNGSVVRVTRKGKASVLTALPAGFLDGIAFDGVGRFGYRLLVADLVGAEINLYGIDCRGRARLFGQGLPHVEGGMVVAPAGFGRFGGELIAADELTGNIYAFSAKGETKLIANSGLPAGGDVGTESLGFFPGAAASYPTAYVASAQGATNAPGANSVLSIGPNGLRRARLRPGDLLAASETAGTTVRVRCAGKCSVRRVADGPAAAHVEGHIVFALPR